MKNAGKKKIDPRAIIGDEQPKYFSRSFGSFINGGR